MRTTTYEAFVDELTTQHGRESVLRYLENDGGDEIRAALADIGENIGKRIGPYTTARPERIAVRTLVEFRWDAPLAGSPDVLGEPIDMTALIGHARHDTPIRTMVHGTWIHARTIDGTPQEIPLSMDPLDAEDRAWHNAFDACLHEAEGRPPWPETPPKGGRGTASIEVGTYRTLEHILTTDGIDTSGSHRLRLETHLQALLDALPGADVEDKVWCPVEGTQTPGHLISIKSGRTRYAAPREHRGLVAYNAAFSRDQTMRTLISVVGPFGAPGMAVRRALERARACTDWTNDDEVGDIRFDAIALGDQNPYLEGYGPEDITL